EVIGRGGMGVVFKARQIGLDRRGALKMILAGRFATEGDPKRVQNEAEAAPDLDHPHNLPLYQGGGNDGHHYFTMKLIDGGNLGQRLTELRDDPKRTARIMAAVARAIHHAHLRGVLHRDLKPSNILIDAQGNPYVSDFGLAKRARATD